MFLCTCISSAIGHGGVEGLIGVGPFQCCFFITKRQGSCRPWRTRERKGTSMRKRSGGRKQAWHRGKKQFHKQFCCELIMEQSSLSSFFFFLFTLCSTFLLLLLLLNTVITKCCFQAVDSFYAALEGRHTISSVQCEGDDPVLTLCSVWGKCCSGRTRQRHRTRPRWRNRKSLAPSGRGGGCGLGRWRHYWGLTDHSLTEGPRQESQGY